ncbi:MAG: hypothetical protein J6O99_00830, partial [Methanobrevibacter sp.]|nr:hypothetical protein [Methanobrevibacter sp.]
SNAPCRCTHISCRRLSSGWRRSWLATLGLAKSHYQIGAFSTAIYEGLAFNCKTFIIDVPGVEYLDDLIDKDIVKRVKSSEELINYINNGNISIQEYDKDYFFKNFDETIFKKILSD